MRLRTLYGMVVMPLLLVVGGVILLTPKDILRQPLLSSSEAPSVTGASAEVMSIAALDRTELAAEADGPRAIPATLEADLPPADTSNALWITARSLNMRAGPDKGADLVATLPFGTEVTVIEIDGQWAMVSGPGGETGWMSTSFLSEQAPAVQ